MPILTKAADLATRKLPKFISPQAHKTADYAIMSGFAAAGVVYWNRDRRAAVASWLCGGSMLALNLATRYGQSGRKRPVSFLDHRRTELGMAAAIALIPKLMRIGKMARAHFTLQSAALIALGNLTETTWRVFDQR